MLSFMMRAFIACFSLGCLSFLSVLLWFAIHYSGYIASFEQAVSQLGRSSLMYDRTGKLLSSVDAVEDRLWVAESDISPYLKLAVLSIEDSRFFQHRGLDLLRIGGALWSNLQAGRYRQGGSTLTQQLVKLTVLSSEKTLSRKTREAFIAIAVELYYSKSQIFEYYLNTIYLAHGNYGVEQASQEYFQKSAKQLNIAEAAFLAGVIQRPEGYLRLPSTLDPKDPHFPSTALRSATRRQHQVLDRMLSQGWISKKEHQHAKSVALPIHKPQSLKQQAPYFMHAAVKQLQEQANISDLSKGGYRLQTTLDAQLQFFAEQAVEQAFQKYPKAFEQMALVAIQPQTSEVLALVGGRNFEESQFNRATQAKRQPGSVFKTIVYATAFEHAGFHLSDSFFDEALSYESVDSDGALSWYQPKNFDRQYGAERAQAGEDGQIYYANQITLESAFVQSINTVAVQLLHQVGIPQLQQVSQKLGLSINSKQGLCLALGCGEVSLLEITNAYAVLMNDGMYQSPQFFIKVYDPEKDKVLSFQQKSQKVFSSETVYQMREMMHRVLTQGTGRHAYWEDAQHLLIGKTGTNERYRDAWFVGGSPELMVGVWIGNDDNRPMRYQTGGNIPAKTWKAFMQQALQSVPEHTLPLPPEHRRFWTCRVSGKMATERCPDIAEYPYFDKALHFDTCELHPGLALSQDLPLDHEGSSFQQKLHEGFEH